jgi:histidinol dehydrogenase
MYTTEEFKTIYATKNDIDWSLFQDVSRIIQSVQKDGDLALKSYSAKFDGVELLDFEVPQASIKDAYQSIDDSLRQALEVAKENIETYQKGIKWKDNETGELYQKIHPLNRVGIYVPGGTAPLASTVLMTAVLAKVAGVAEIVVTTPPQEGGINKAILAACFIAGVDHVYQVGGAQAIAALAYGTETIPKVDKIVGPGNQFVALAKKIVYGDVGIDSIAGPSEIVVVIDETANPTWVAYDLLAQAEHDVNARTFLISEDQSILQAVSLEVEKLTVEQPRKTIIQESLANNHYVVHTNNKQETIDVVNLIAGEHISIQTKDAETYIGDITTGGALFIGEYAPEALGDYVAGPSHVLPTGGTARFSNGLSVNDFLRTNSVIHVKKETFEEMAPFGMRIAKEEDLKAHHDSLQIRLSNKEN